MAWPALQLSQVTILRPVGYGPTTLDKDDQAKVDKAEEDQAGALIFVTQNEKPELPLSTSSLSLSSDYDVQIQQEIPRVQSAPLLDVLVSVIPEQTTPTPLLTSLPTPPTTTDTQATVISVPDPSPTVLERLSELEKKVEALSKVDHSKAIEESVQASVINEVKNQLPKFLPKAVSDFVNPGSESTVRNVLQKSPVFLAQSSSTPAQPSSRAAESLSEYE
ncbi:hypothetical protein Tco_0577627 [Tanacetum coccineum]